MTDSAEDGARQSSPLLWLVPLLGVAMTLAAALWLRRRLRRRKAGRGVRHRAGPQRRLDEELVKPVLASPAEAPVCLAKSVLEHGRFTANPEYDWGAGLAPFAGPFAGPFAAIRAEWIELEHEIGEGCFGKVFRGRLARPGGRSPEPVAVKALKSAAGPAAHDDLLQEAEIMASFSHENILSLKGIVNGTSSPYRLNKMK